MSRSINIPNALTASRILLTPVFIACLLASGWGWKWLALLVFTIASLTDLYDGYLARRENSVTTLGRFLDPLADKILASAAMIAFVVAGLVEMWLVIVIVARDVIVTGFRMYRLHRGRQVVTSKLAKWKTTAELTVIFLILTYVSLETTLRHFAHDGLNFPWVSGALNVLVGFVALLTIISAVSYFADHRKVASKRHGTLSVRPEVRTH
ncbi:MAG: CDP-diacylglycerol--glycerol-3-phosphate 3-phosphatidyltransferase [Candidatus Latescibacterota bacterium]